MTNIISQNEFVMRKIYLLIYILSKIPSDTAYWCLFWTTKNHTPSRYCIAFTLTLIFVEEDDRSIYEHPGVEVMIMQT